MSFAYKVLEHLLRHFKISNHAVFHRADGDDVAGRAAQHLFGVAPDGFDRVGNLVDGDNGWLRDDDAASLRVNECVSRAEINRQITGKKAKK
jgi:hypothetical protein